MASLSMACGGKMNIFTVYTSLLSFLHMSPVRVLHHNYTHLVQI